VYAGAGSRRAALPRVILTEPGGLLVLFGLKTRWAALALFGFCLLTAAFFHMAADQAVQLQRIAMAEGFLALALLGPGAWSLDAAARSREPTRARTECSTAQFDHQLGQPV
jgi:putative oxidoreductase